MSNKIKRGEKKFKIIKIIILIFVILAIYNYKTDFLGLEKNKFLRLNNQVEEYIEEYKTIKLDNNDNYNGLGQEKINNKDGYFTTFTTIKKSKKIYKEYKQNGSSSWSNNKYWGGTMEENGCGITVVSIILSGYNKDYTPEKLRKKYYPVLDYKKLPEELNLVYGIKNSGFYYNSKYFTKESIETHLKSNRPIIVCVWNNKKNRWTKSSHYIALLATDEKGSVYVSNPNGLEDNSKSSGWYDINEIVPYIASAIYIQSY